MNFWQIIKILVKDLSFDKKRFFLFLLIVVVGTGAYLVWRGQTQPQAAVVYDNETAFASQMQSDIIIQKNGTVMVDGREKRGAMRYFNEYDELNLLVFDNPSDYINRYVATVHLPGEASSNELRLLIYAVHGVGDTINYQSDSKTLIYQVSDISPGASVSIVARLPKGMINVPLWKRMQLSFENMTIRAWIYLAAGICALTFFILIFIFLRQRSELNLFAKAILSRLPDKIPPALAGVVIDGSVGAREIAATLIDLALRGYIFIYNKGNGEFDFGKRRFTSVDTAEGLSDFEKALLSKIFLPAAYKSTVEDVELRLGRHIFSRKVADFYVGIYDSATQKGYFSKNPARVHLAFKYTGIALFFLSFLGFLYGAISRLDPKYALFFWLGAMGAAALIIRIAPYMPALTRLGIEKAREWMAFREYLSMRQGVDLAEDLEDKFNEFLPYAVVLGVEVEWMKRFREARFTPPDWYDSPETATTIENFASDIFPIIGYVSKHLARAHDPSVE